MSRQMKAHKNYDELIALLESRGMTINDREHAKKKLSQVGYYRLSGFWFPCQITVQEENGKFKKDNKFFPETCFRDVYPSSLKMLDFSFVSDHDRAHEN